MKKAKYFNVQGITFKRPPSKLTGLDLIKKYSGHAAKYKLKREPDNDYDKNAIQVKQVFKNGGSIHIGYVPKELAAELAPLLDDGDVIEPKFSQCFINEKTGEIRGMQLKY
jgi:hypothetical protein